MKVKEKGPNFKSFPHNLYIPLIRFCIKIEGRQHVQNEICVVLVTCGSRAEAENIAERVVQERLAACVNLIAEGGSIRSFYTWEGALQKEEEWLLMIKTQISLLQSLEKRVKELHSYTVPEFIALPVIGGSSDYLGWLRQSVKSTE